MPKQLVAQPDAAGVRRLVAAALEEDGARNDITTRALVAADQRGQATIVAKEDCLLAGMPVVKAVFETMDTSVRVASTRPEGALIGPGSLCARLSGPLSAILSGERVALNFLQQLSGVATATGRMVEAVAGLSTEILDTRKTTPGLRELERYAVRVGGGTNHRFNLSDAVLVKDNHLAALRLRGCGIRDAVDRVSRAAPPSAKIMIEVTSLGEAEEALKAGARWLLLDNMSTNEMRDVVRAARSYPGAKTEASGGVTLDNVRSIAETGVDAISIGALTHSAPATDFSLDVKV
jgi:nicotinate-nucleotide pyrophosphorylase (carboxylating)